MDLFFLIKELLIFILNIYADSNLPRSVVDTVIDFFDKFNQNHFIPSLRADILEALENEQLSERTKMKLNSVFDDYKTLFVPLNTEDNRFNLLRKINYRNPQVPEIGNVLEKKSEGNHTYVSFDPVFALVMPLKITLKHFLEIPNVFNSIMEYRSKLLEENNPLIIKNIIQADLFRQKYIPKHCQDIVIPYFIYFDECECGNALGSCAGKNKMSAVYSQIACLPPSIASRLCAIFLSLLMHSKQQKKLSNRETFHKLVDEANDLRQNGVKICVDSKSFVVKFELLLVLGDNLGLNDIFGFTKSFTTDFYCRICKLTNEEASLATIEVKSKIRKRDDYDLDAKIKNVNESGIREACIFHEIQNFHITENTSIDILHDFLEGVCSYDIHQILKVFIFDKKIFKLNDLNEQIECFEYKHTGCNKPPPIKENHLKQRFNLKMSASEISCLTRYLPLFIGHFVEEEDEHWQLFILLRRIFDILACHFVRRDNESYLQSLIEEHHELYIKLFGPLKPKHHFLIHYPRLLTLLGPCVNYSTMRFESRHRPIKSVVTSTSCKKNLLYTIGVKEQLRLCQIINNQIFIENESDREDCFNMLKIELEGINYEVGMFLPINIQQHNKLFGKIINIVRINKKCYFTMETYEEKDFDSHYYAYVVRRVNEDLSIFSKKICSETTGILFKKYYFEIKI
ncbi:uncharacterized protein LOC111694374 [Trichogramma pretiosum]|uniref:uncharacterized protein LOC111694374 n=1 Tax=Trichogramma pretiosum TaxID=7493 RepID=UPI000C71C3E5|nr:uncharacterized protein LOC111694374 [Trichogramma pretiosum]